MRKIDPFENSAWKNEIQLYEYSWYMNFILKEAQRDCEVGVRELVSRLTVRAAAFLGSMASPIKISQLNPGDFIHIRSKKNDGGDDHHDCVYKVKSITPSGWVSFEVCTINEKPVKRAEKGLKPSGGYDEDFYFFLEKGTPEAKKV